MLSCQCFLHLAYVLCFVVLGAHLVPSVLAALGICVGYMWCWERTYVLAICGAGSAPMCWLYVLWGAWHAPGTRGERPL